MRNFIQESDVINVKAPYNLTMDDGCLVGSLFGVATKSASTGVSLDLMTEGVFTLTAASTVVAAQGDRAYWDDANRRITNDGGVGVLVGAFAVDKTNGQTVATVALGVFVQSGSGSQAKSANFALTAADDGKVFNCTAALTVTIPAGLTPRPAVAIIPPPAGNLSIAVSGGAQINGATTTLTRSRASNVAGVAIQPYMDADGYGVSGS